MSKFMVVYLVSQDVIDNWTQTDPAVRAPAEQKMRADWDRWMETHGAMLLSTEAAGKTKRVTTGGAADARNGIMLVSTVEAASHDAVAKAFEDHPHLGIPQASIEIMRLLPMTGM